METLTKITIIFAFLLMSGCVSNLATIEYKDKLCECPSENVSLYIDGYDYRCECEENE